MKRLVLSAVVCALAHVGTASAAELTPGQKKALQELSPRLQETRLSEDGVPSWLSGELGSAAGEPREAALQALRRLAPLFRGRADDGFEPVSATTDRLGQTHVRVQQRFRGLSVIGSELIVHLAGGQVIGVNGNYAPDIAVSVVPALSGTQAIERAAAALPGLANALAPPVLVVYPTRDRTPHLAWSAPVSFKDPSGFEQKEVIYADAQSGGMLGRSPMTMLAKSRQLFDNHVNCPWGSVLPLLWSEGDPLPSDPAEMAVLTTTGHVYDYYLNVHNRDSFDDQGTTIKARVHSVTGAGCTDSNVLAWSSITLFGGLVNNELYTGDGDGVVLANPARSLTLVAHEFNHGVVNFSARLNYQNEPGALNESFSDALAVGAQFYTFGVTNWKIGGEASVYTPGIPGDAQRYMFNPPLDLGQTPSDPSLASVDYYPYLLGGFFCNPIATFDHCYVHYNSGIGNLAFYLLSHGGVHPQATPIDPNIPALFVAGVGIDVAQKIWYRALTTYMVSESNYADARSATAHAAADLYGGACSPTVQSVERAWTAVGVLNPYPALPCGFNLLADSGFESGYWELSNPASTGFLNWITNPTPSIAFTNDFFDVSSIPPAHTGSRKAWFGNPYVSQLPATMYQEVTIPALGPNPTARLSYWIRIQTTSQTPNADKFVVELRNGSNQLLKAFAVYSNSSPIANSGSYSFELFDMTATAKKLAGQKVRLYFRLLSNDYWEDFSNGTHYSSTKFYVDDVAMVIQ